MLSESRRHFDPLEANQTAFVHNGFEAGIEPLGTDPLPIVWWIDESQETRGGSVIASTMDKAVAHSTNISSENTSVTHHFAHEERSKLKQYCTFYTTSAKKNRKSRQRKSCPTIPVGSNPPEVISQNQKPPYERQQQNARKQQQPLLNASVDASSVHYIVK